MKTNYWFTVFLIYSLGVEAGFTAQPSHANKTGSKSSTKPAPKPAVTISPGPAVVSQEHVNVRARADLDSEVIAHLKKKDLVMVLEEVTLKKPGPGEPTHWAKIALPAEVPVWVYSGYLDRSASEVKVPKLNLRSGAGENFSVVGSLEKGVSVKKLDEKGDWWKIEAPNGCHAYVAASLLEPKPANEDVVVVASGSVNPATPGSVPGSHGGVRPPRTTPTRSAPTVAPPPVPSPTSAPPTPAPIEPPRDVVVNAPPSSPTSSGTPLPPPTPPPKPGGYSAVAPSGTPAGRPPSTSATPPPQPSLSLPVTSSPSTLSREPGEVDFRPLREDAYVKRVVTREGLVRRSLNLQSPTPLLLENLQNGRVMNYLYSTTTNLNLAAFRGRVVTVTGEEALDERWPNIPVIRVETLQTAP